MIRRSYLEKFYKKDTPDSDLSLMKKKARNDYYVGRIKSIERKDIKQLSDQNLEIFIEDLYKSKKLNKVLFPENARKEIEYYQKTYDRIKKMVNIKEKQQQHEKTPKSDTFDLLKRNEAFEEFAKTRKVIQKLKKERAEKERQKTQSVYESYRKYKREITEEKQNYQKQKIKEKADESKKGLFKLKKKLDFLKDSNQVDDDVYSLFSNQNIRNERLDTLDIQNQNIRYNTEKKIIFPNYKLNPDDASSRLYHNVVKRVPLKLNNNSYDKDNSAPVNSLVKKNNIKFNIKNVFDQNQGKEFSVRITDDMNIKCLLNYSGGYEGLKYSKLIKENPDLVSAPNQNKSKDALSVFNYKDSRGNTFLHIATIENVPEVAKHLIDKGCNIDEPNNEGKTPLHIAMKKGRLEIIGYLIKAGASLEKANANGDDLSKYSSLIQSARRARKENTKISFVVDKK